MPPLVDRHFPVETPDPIAALRAEWFAALERADAEGTSFVAATPFLAVGHAA